MNYAIIGVGGYIAPKHLQAVKETGGNLVAAMDVNDSVGILDSFFPEAEFFIEYERFERHLNKLYQKGTPVDYLIVCTPNYLHDVHSRLGLNVGANVICEKPVVVNPWNLDILQQAEQQSGKKVNCILQMRLNPAVDQIKILSKLSKRSNNQIKIDYITPRGKWYDLSWKANKEKSGGLIYNIGIHYLDLMCQLYGDVYKTTVTENNARTIKGVTWFDKAEVEWSLSIDGQLPKREISVNGESVDLSGNFSNLHTESYRKILAGKGFGLDSAYAGVCLAYSIVTGESPYEHFYSRK